MKNAGVKQKFPVSRPNASLLLLLGEPNAIHEITDINIAPTFICFKPPKFPKVAPLKITHTHTHNFHIFINNLDCAT